MIYNTNIDKKVSIIFNLPAFEDADISIGEVSTVDIKDERVTVIFTSGGTVSQHIKEGGTFFDFKQLD
jgi:hypothetical protein